MTISQAFLILYLNMVPLGLIVIGCFIFYSFVLWEHNRINDND